MANPKTNRATRRRLKAAKIGKTICKRVVFFSGFGYQIKGWLLISKFQKSVIVDL